MDPFVLKRMILVVSLIGWTGLALSTLAWVVAPSAWVEFRLIWPTTFAAALACSPPILHLYDEYLRDRAGR